MCPTSRLTTESVMRHGFKTGAAEAIRLANRFIETNGLSGLRCVDAQYYEAGQQLDMVREMGLVTWTVRFEGLLAGSCDDGSILVLVDLERGDARRLDGLKDD